MLEKNIKSQNKIISSKKVSLDEKDLKRQTEMMAFTLLSNKNIQNVDVQEEIFASVI